MTAVSVLQARCLAAAIVLVLLAAPCAAQEVDHSKMHHPPPKQAPPTKKPVVKKPAAKKPAAKPAAKKPATVAPASRPAPTRPPPAKDPHAGHAAPAPSKSKAASPAPVGRAAEATHDHHDHGGQAPKAGSAERDQQARDATDHSGMDHSGMDHSGMDHAATPDARTQPLTPIPVLTDADRIGALPPEHAHPAHDDEIHYHVLLNRLEAWGAEAGTAAQWEGQAWIGTDLRRLWLRSEGERSGDGLESASVEVLHGRSVTPWWDVVAGVRHDFAPGASQDFLALGVMGLAPYMFEVEATAYLGPSGRSALRVETEYEMLLTNRLILQPLVEVNVYGKTDRSRGVGSGLGTVEAGLRLRYEIDRRFAPYIGVVRERAFGHTANLRRGAGEHVDDTHAVAGFRIWF